MALLLRTVRQNRWYKQVAEAYLAEDDVPADPLGDLNTSQGLLSVWELEEDRSNLERVVRAVAAGKEHLDNAGYVTFDSRILDEAGIEVQVNPGNSPDKDANVWHRDIVLSGNKVVRLAKGILRHGDSGQVLRKRMAELITQGVQDGHLGPEVKEKFAKKKCTACGK